MTWLPLESNPEVLNQFVQNMGFPVENYQSMDVFGTEDWAIEMVPSPVIGVVFLYPFLDPTDQYREAEAARIVSEGQIVDESVYYLLHTVGNACGSIGFLHACGIINDKVPPEKDSHAR
eukprot:FR744180.1.p2 GENE.FR744180.1~~FR744180.1.p2  ORF type:complete len:119 (+),score=6.69 FR744180.1:183-539(+)